ncbi:EAL domain-containing protein [Cellulomonas fimi]|uniref:EAL domain-containing protein n=1 Tax=Cellulomonas fimi TaxID=1708 RepID=A0A7Y0QI14_CELFI|nr:EAL domain-containing protein [Cellulomonas fimi]NMR19757.1 EAL domain-containing protein [Cellulomonas fimi]
MAEPLTVLAVSPGTGGYFFGEVLAGLTREVRAVGGRVVVVQTLGPGAAADELDEPTAFSTPVAWARADGVVAVTSAVQAPYLERLRAAGTPVVCAGMPLDGFEAPLAVPDNEGGTADAVAHLLEHGHTRIGYVGPLDRADLRDRLTAYRDTLTAHGLDADPALVVDVPGSTPAAGAAAAAQLLALDRRPTAVMVATDRIAIGLMGALADAGVVVPRDLAVIAFDNIEAAAFSSPPLSSVNQRFDEVGALAGRLVLAQIRGDAVPAVAHTSPAAGLALRASCGCAPDVAGGTGSAQPVQAYRPSPLEELSELLRGALLTYDSTADGPTEDAVLAMAVEVEALLEAGDAVPAERLEALTTSLRRVATDASVLHRTLGALTEYLERTGAATPDQATADDALGDAGRTAATRVAAALWQMQAGSFRVRAESLEALIEEQVALDKGLLDVGSAEAHRLAWLTGTHVRAGVLGLWDGEPGTGPLRIAGSYDPDGLLTGVLGTTMPVESFPPAPLVGGTPDSADRVCVVVPVRTAERDWGMLALVGAIVTTSSRETYHHWAALLCAALEEERLHQTVRASEERYALAALATNDGLWEWDARTSALYLSDRCWDLLGLDRATENRLEAWRALIHPDDVADMEHALRKAVAGHEATVLTEYRVRTADGSYRWALARALSVRAADGSVERIVGSLSDIHERRSLEDQLRENALYDALTGLPNRRLFLDRLEHAVAQCRRSRTPFAVLFLDLDGFKVVNDSLGHQAGDRLLTAVGNRIEHQLRAVDTGARFGGDEFAILLHDVEPHDVLHVAQRVQAALAEVIDLDGNEVAIRASLGIATSAIDYASAEDVLRDADTAMYHAKATERGSVSFFDAAMHANAVHHLRLDAELRRALDEEQFEVHYQPIVDLASGLANSFEALVRWRHPERGMVPPDQFLPIMEETGLIVRLGHWVIEEVCRQLAVWGPAVVNVSVNISDREFWHSGLLPHVLHCLGRHGLTADRMTIEITEGVIMRRPELALRLMKDMHDAGLQLHIDDFGTGYSSLETLHRFPVEAFKIDRSFIRGVMSGDRTADLVRVIVAMGKALGLAVVAEGVETTDQLAFLQEIGCVTGQGYLFMPAVAGDAAGELVGQVLGGGPVVPTQGGPTQGGPVGDARAAVGATRGA